jgi:hypothetical protein
VWIKSDAARFSVPPTRSICVPRFFFHTQTDTRFTDEEGIELPDAVAARGEAIRMCGEMMRDAPEGFWGSRPWTVTVTDATGLVLWDISIDGAASAAAAHIA